MFMEDIISYTKGKDSLKNKEKHVSDIIDLLDKESYKLFCEIMDLDDDSLYKANSISTRIIELSNLYNRVVQAYENINDIEESSYLHISKKYQIKRMMLMITSVYAFLISIFHGIVVFILLSKMNNKSYREELNELLEIEQIDESKFDLIDVTLDNCDRIFNGKLDRVSKKISSNSIYDYDIVTSNMLITLYLQESITKENFESLSIESKERIINILKNDLNTDCNDLYELLDMAKKEDHNSKVLIKKIQNS